MRCTDQRTIAAGHHHLTGPGTRPHPPAGAGRIEEVEQGTNGIGRGRERQQMGSAEAPDDGAAPVRNDGGGLLLMR